MANLDTVFPVPNTTRNSRAVFFCPLNTYKYQNRHVEKRDNTVTVYCHWDNIGFFLFSIVNSGRNAPVGCSLVSENEQYYFSHL